MFKLDLDKTEEPDSKTHNCQYVRNRDRASLVAQMVKHLPTMQETQV